MFFYKFNALLLVAALAWQTTCFGAAPPPSSDRSGETNPKLQQDALGLLRSVAREVGQFESAENRVRARTLIADLLWPHDEPAARLVSDFALGELRRLLDQADAAAAAEMSDEQRNEHSVNRFRLADLRREYVLMLAGRDAAAAVDALRRLKTKKQTEWEPLAERELDLRLEVAVAVAANDADRAEALYRDEIKTGGLSPQLLDSFGELHRQNAALTRKIFLDTLALVKAGRIGEKTTGGERNSQAAPSVQTIEFWQAIGLLNAADALDRRAARDSKSTAPLNAAEMRELAELIARAFLNAPNPGKNTINQAMTAITRRAPEEARAIRLKVGEEGVRAIETVMRSDAFSLSLREKNAEELAREAARTADPIERDLLYAAAVRKALAAAEPEKAQSIAARIEESESYRMLIDDVETAAALAVARRADDSEVRRLLARLKTKEKRLAVMLEYTHAVADRGDRETAKKLFDESERMLVTAPPAGEPDAGETLVSVIETIAKFAVVAFAAAPDEAFPGVETMIETVSPKFAREEKAKEFFYGTMERELLLHTPDSVELLKSMARSDFARAVKTLDRFERPEIRRFARLQLVRALLDQKAGQKDRQLREQFLAELSES